MLSAFIAAFLARGMPLQDASLVAKARVAEAMERSTRPGGGRAIGMP
jgi:hydroxymethylpyrimidine/phosphomethylpyrimidine kinase